MRTVNRELPEFALALRAARKSADLTQQTMAEVFQMPKRTIEEWERGAAQPPSYIGRLFIEKLESIKSQRAD